MTAKSPKEVLKAIKDPELLEHIAVKRKIDLTDKVKKKSCSSHCR